MLIVCPSCASTYTLTEAQLGRGRTLRCAECRHTWHATPEDALREPELATASAMATIGAQDLPHAMVEAPLSDAGSWPDPGHDATPEPVATEPPRPRTVRRATSRRPRPDHHAFVTRLRAVPAWQVALACTVLALVVATALREPVVRAMPQTARLFAAIGFPVNLRGLALDGVHSELIADKDQTVIVVEGTIRNLRKGETSVPPLALTVRAQDGGDVFAWTADVPRAVLAAGETTPFRTRVVAPPLDATGVLVRFARDAESAPAVH